jgi:hypothetical protein
MKVYTRSSFTPVRRQPASRRALTPKASNVFLSPVAAGTTVRSIRDGRLVAGRPQARPIADYPDFLSPSRF